MSLPNESPGTPKSRWAKQIQHNSQPTGLFTLRKWLAKVNKNVNANRETSLSPVSRFKRQNFSTCPTSARVGELDLSNSYAVFA